MSKKKTVRTVAQFETQFAGGKVKDLQHKLEVERAKVAALADVQNKVIIDTNKTNKLKFGLCGDLHIGSLYAHESALVGFYEYLYDQGVDRVYCTGDILDGHKVYRGQEFELCAVGADAQLKRLADVMKKNTILSDIDTVFITGNHDQSFKSLAGMHIGHAIEQVCAWKFVGEEQARVRFDTPNGKYELMMIHPGSGSSYALSYKPQKIVESLEGGTKPNMVAIGHYHKAEQMPTYRNICAIQTGTFQKQTPFMARQGLAAHVGGWLIEVDVGKTWNVITARFVAVYV